MILKGRNNALSGENYRFGFNGYENTDEILGDNSAIDFGARVYDCRIGKFLSVDPLLKEYSWQSPYAYYANSPISTIDINGRGKGWVLNCESGEAVWDPNINSDEEFEKSTYDKENYSYEGNDLNKLSNGTNVVYYCELEPFEITANRIEKSAFSIAMENAIYGYQHSMDGTASTWGYYDRMGLPNPYIPSNEQMDREATMLTMTLITILSCGTSSALTGSLGWGGKALLARSGFMAVDYGVQYASNLTTSGDPMSSFNDINLTSGFMTFLNPFNTVQNSLVSSQFEINPTGFNTILNGKSTSDANVEAVTGILFGKLISPAYSSTISLQKATYNSLLNETQISLERVYGAETYSIMFNKGMYTTQGILNIMSNEAVIEGQGGYLEGITINLFLGK